MGDKGKRDKGKREGHKKVMQTLEEKRRQKKVKRNRLAQQKIKGSLKKTVNY